MKKQTDASKKKPDVKAFNIRIPRDVWVFLRKASIQQETSMNEIITRCITKYKNKLQNNVLTDSDTIV